MKLALLTQITMRARELEIKKFASLGNTCKAIGATTDKQEGPNSATCCHAFNTYGTHADM